MEIEKKILFLIMNYLATYGIFHGVKLEYT